MFGLVKKDYKKLALPFVWFLASLGVSLSYSFIKYDCSTSEPNCVCDGRNPFSVLSWYYSFILSFGLIHDLFSYHTEKQKD